MIKILAGESVSKLDQLHCKSANISSYELMEKAAQEFEKWFYHQEFSKESPILIFCGSGNNGGDGFAIARLLSQKNHKILVIKCFGDNSKLSADAGKNLEMLPTKVKEVFFKEFQAPTEPCIIIDAFLGVGLSGPLRDSAKPIIERMNSLQGKKIAIDIPSGLPSEGLGSELSFQADVTVSFAFPKLALILPENAESVGELEVCDIGIPDKRYEEFEGSLYFIQAKDIPALHKKFHRFSHKGDFGKILLVGGGHGKMGAIILAAKSALRTGSGLVTCHIEESERLSIQAALPEAMCNWGLIPNADYYDAVGIGPGWGVESRKNQLEALLKDFHFPIVLDADGINILAKFPELIPLVPKNSILTPHIGEFQRLVGPASNHQERMNQAKDFAIKHELILILKGANTVISMPDGRQLINSTGTQFMATGGAGDILTGMITGYLGMGYSPESAAVCGVFHHGLAGELAGKRKGRGTIAGDIIESIPETYFYLDIS
ncbi:NAD(P)H-hydrate epimerase [Algoriphagus ornithinivorans]|uniref:Bifunctional NAD(P)H-hydrate repair enzyme n=1 Tax=Algoriphagus ornithinivorans TaxID=226506 RepID=A0A1I5AEF4_9BACT|nr:NAD(P)H-hydrate dehydratase [Algoriphagus ornithinivorans]SFN60792.1 NAD(P)H-hydrate epimerase [Algoriphagus ornithinivorans]